MDLAKIGQFIKDCRIIYLRIIDNDFEGVPSDRVFDSELTSKEYKLNGVSYKLTSGRIEYTDDLTDLTSIEIGSGLVADVCYWSPEK